MGVQGKISGGWVSMLKRSAIGAGAFALALILGNGLSAWLIASEYIPETAAGYCILLGLILAVFTGNLVAMKNATERRLILALMVSGTCFLVLSIFKMLCFPGTWNGVGVTAGAVAGCSVAWALFTPGRGKGAAKRKNRKKLL